MTSNGSSAQPLSLTIGELARRTGLTPPVLRMWETRHGFPVATRLDSGHRRYDERDVGLVEKVLHRRNAGLRLDVAIAEVVGSSRRTPPSVHAAIRAAHPALAPHHLSKSTLLALTRAMEDECCARAQHAVLFGGFQHERFYRAAENRWKDLARTNEQTLVFAALGDDRQPAPQGSGAQPVLVHLPDDAPLRREWFLVCDSAEHPALLSAWELPGQDDVLDGERVFESVWSLDPVVVRAAAEQCAVLAQEFGDLDLALDRRFQPVAASADLAGATSMFNRLLGYLDGPPGLGDRVRP